MGKIAWEIAHAALDTVFELALSAIGLLAFMATVAPLLVLALWIVGII